MNTPAVASASSGGAAGVRQQYSTFSQLLSAVGSGKQMELCWLSPRELAEGSQYRNPTRRQSWFFGRVAAKQLIASSMGFSLQDPRRIEIFTRNSSGQSVRPETILDGQQLPGVLSLSHTDRAVLAAWSTSPGCRLGVDLAEPTQLSAGFLSLWFTAAEQERLRAGGNDEIVRCWALKEAVYKALNSGESFAPRSVEVQWDTHGVDRVVYRGVELRTHAHLQIFRLDGQTAVVASLNETESAGVEFTVSGNGAELN
ncbi:MAG: 4'-phosphopantetheinyl transferase superfamily protein [Planctomycetaceae bacterium]|nr:4'-phosphopantetheinyl transferase superfamily protein [Planctomycetaceae bacterium]